MDISIGYCNKVSSICHQLEAFITRTRVLFSIDITQRQDMADSPTQYKTRRWMGEYIPKLRHHNRMYRALSEGFKDWDAKEGAAIGML